VERFIASNVNSASSGGGHSKAVHDPIFRFKAVLERTGLSRSSLCRKVTEAVSPIK
jgi:hypothetical protein